MMTQRRTQRLKDLQEKIDADIQAFLDDNGQIEQCPSGVSKDDDDSPQRQNVRSWNLKKERENV